MPDGTTSLTPEQEAAVGERRASVSLSAGAGCGKTTALTARYLSHLDLDGAAVPQVLAITFTERAARQMRRKVRTALAGRGDSARGHLAHLDAAPVQTIHAFCAALLRRYAAEAGVDPAFAVLDDATAARHRADAVRTTLRRLVPADPDVRDLIVLFGYAAVAATLDELLADPDPAGWDRHLAGTPAAIAKHWLGTNRDAVLDRYLKHLSVGDRKLARFHAALATAQPTGPIARSTLAGLKAGLENLRRATDLAAAVEELTELAKVKNSPKRDWPDDAAYESIRDAFAEFREALPKRLEAFTAPADPSAVAEAAAVGQKMLRAARAAYDRYRADKRAAAALDFSDLLTLARDLVRDHAEVRDELAARFRFVLVDEFQDTDPVQYELIERLCGDAFHTQKTFAVGDEKQSIYRFRGAAVELCRAFRAGVPAAGRHALTVNFRSRPGVLGFVNAVFAPWLTDYEPLVPRRAAVGEPGVEFLWSLPAEDGGDESADDRRRREAAAIARRIEALLTEPPRPFASKAGGPDEIRKVRKGDVCLLFRSMSNVATYERALTEKGLDYYLVGGRAFFARQEIFDVVTALRAVENPQDGEAVVGLLRSPFFGLSDEGVTLVATHPDGPWAGLLDPVRVGRLAADDRKIADRAKDRLTAWRDLKDRLPAARLLLRLFADTGFDAATRFAPLADRQLANLWKLVDVARDFDRRGLDLAAVVAHFSDRVASSPKEEQAATTPEDDDVIRLMTIHQAKGLEFPVVFVPDLSSETRGDTYPAVRWDRMFGAIPKRPYDLRDGDEGDFSEVPHLLAGAANTIAAWEEDLRIFYVACTRAEERLILSAGLSKPEVEPEGPMLFALDRAYDLDTGIGRAGGPTVPVLRGRDP